MAKETEGGLTKIDAVRQIVSKHGKEVKAAEIVELMKKEHNLDITLGTATNYKSIAVKESEPAAKEPKPKPQPKPSEAPAKPAKTAPSGTDSGITLEEIAAVKALVDQMGAEKVGKLAKVLGK